VPSRGERENRMAITDEVRQLARRRSFTAEELLDIADRIDEKHKKAMDNSYRDGYQEGKRDGEDDWYEEHEAYLEEHGWYQALDADKEPIKFGDEVEWRHPNGSCELRHGIVVGIKTDKIGDEMFYGVTIKVDRFTVRLMANQLRHYHAPEPDTWERIIEDALMGADRDGAPDTYQGCMDELVARCKALAGDAE